jgi:hypothetical protein
MIALNDFLTWQWALLRNVEYGVVGFALFIIALELLSRYMNHSLGITFKEHGWDKIKDTPIAVSLYFGLRNLGVLLAGGLFLAAFVK